MFNNLNAKRDLKCIYTSADVLQSFVFKTKCKI